MDNGIRTIKTTANSRFAKAGASCFYDSEVQNPSFVHLMKFSAKNPRLRKAAKRYGIINYLRKKGHNYEFKFSLPHLSSCRIRYGGRCSIQ
jgi:hypothetical protein